MIKHPFLLRARPGLFWACQLFVLTLALLASCGQTDAPSSARLSQVAYPPPSTPTTKPFNSIGATKTTVAERIIHEEQTAAALPTNTTPFVPATVLASIATPVTGVSTACEESGFERRIARTNCWFDIINGTYTTVVVGSLKADPTQGSLDIYTWKPENTETNNLYATPTKAGALTIIAVTMPRITLVAGDGTTVVFNLTTRTWEALVGEPALAITGSVATGALTVTVLGRFSLVFDAAQTWQAAQWYDLARTAPTNLARTDGPSSNYNVLQAPLELGYDQWYNIGNATNASLQIKAQDSTHVVLETGWQWTATDGSTFVVTATHTIATIGIWQVTTTLTNTSSSARVLNNGLEYGFTNVKPDLPWQETLTENNRSVIQTLPDSLAPRSSITVQRLGGQGVVDTDGSGNRYWHVPNITLTPGEAWNVAWFNQIWPGQP